MFLNKDWNNLGTRRDLKHLIQIITGIQDLDNYSTASLAQKFSWASKRKKTREEDKAYSLLGLVGVNMPLLYGEGDKALERLQQEPLAQTDDDSIFAWGLDSDRVPSIKELDRAREPEPLYKTSSATSMLAESLDLFRYSSGVQRKDTGKDKVAEWSLTNRGLSTTFRGYFKHSQGHIAILLNCSRNGRDPLVVELQGPDNMWSGAGILLYCVRTRTPVRSLNTSQQHMLFKLLIGPIEHTNTGYDTSSESRRLKFSSTSVDGSLDIDPKYCIWTSPWYDGAGPRLAIRTNDSTGVQQIYGVQISPHGLLDSAREPYNADKRKRSTHESSAEVLLLGTEASLGSTEILNCLKPEFWGLDNGSGRSFIVQGMTHKSLYIGCNLAGFGHFVVIIGGREPSVNLVLPALECFQDFFTPDFNGGLVPRLPETQVKQIHDACEAYQNSVNEADLGLFAILKFEPSLWLSASMELKNHASFGSYYDIAFKTWTKNPRGCWY